MTTIQTQAHRGTYTPSSRRVRGVKGFVLGFVALAAAATGIGFAVSGTEAPATVFAPVSHTVPNSEAREATKRLQGTSSVTAPESEVIWYPSGRPDVTTPESEVVWSQPGKPGIR